MRAARPEPRSDDIEPAPADRTHEDDELEDLRKIATKRLNKLIRKALKAYRQGGQFEDHPNARELGGQRSDDALYEATQVLLAQIQRG